MSWLFSRALVEEYSGASCSGGELSAPSNLNPIPQAYLSPDKMTEFSRLSRFGMTFAPLTESRGEELLMWFLAGFPVRTFPLRGGGAGIGGLRSGLWLEMRRIICEVEPRFVFVENSPMLTDRGLDRVLGDLAGMGFDARWGVLGADSLGATQHRERIWILANADNKGWQGAERKGQSDKAREEWPAARRQSLRSDRRYWPPGPSAVSQIPIDADDVAGRVDQLRAIGNGQIPIVAATAWKLLTT